MICSKCSSPMTWDDKDKAEVCFTCGNRAYGFIPKVAEPKVPRPQAPVAPSPSSPSHADTQRAIEGLGKQALDNWQRLYKEQMSNLGTCAPEDAYMELVCEQTMPEPLSKLITMWTQVIYQMPHSEYQAGAFCAISAVKAYLDEVRRLEPKS